jgi:hypothetical protein
MLVLSGLQPSFAADPVVEKPCARIEGLYVPCGGGGGGCGCPSKNSCTETTFPVTCTSSYDGATITENCPYCCFDTKCEEVSKTLECNQSKSICGQACKGTKARTTCGNFTCTNYIEGSYTRKQIKTTSDCLEEIEVETFECNSAGSADGCTCNCQKSGNGCNVVSTGICNGSQCSCGKTGVNVNKQCVKYKQVCASVETIKCKIPNGSMEQVPGPDCSCKCPDSFLPTPGSISNLPNCGTSTTCTPGECVNC